MLTHSSQNSWSPINTVDHKTSTVWVPTRSEHKPSQGCSMTTTKSLIKTSGNNIIVNSQIKLCLIQNKSSIRPSTPKNTSLTMMTTRKYQLYRRLSNYILIHHHNTPQTNTPKSTQHNSSRLTSLKNQKRKKKLNFFKISINHPKTQFNSLNSVMTRTQSTMKTVRAKKYNNKQSSYTGKHTQTSFKLYLHHSPSTTKINPKTKNSFKVIKKESILSRK